MSLITQLPSPPLRNQSQQDFSAAADAFLAALPQMVAEINDVADTLSEQGTLAANAASSLSLVQSLAATVAANTNSVILNYSHCVAQAGAAANSASAAAGSANAAQGFASQAQAVSPDSPMRLNLRKITSNFTVGSNYNAVSAGPIEVAEGVTVTINEGATWSIV
jgi:hypothetical protein